MSNIGICLYGYQSKFLIDTLKDLCQKYSGQNKLYIHVIDQNNVERSRRIDIKDDNIQITYEYVKWDSLISPIILKEKAFKSLNKEYYLELGSEISFNKNWDQDLINFLKENEVISGKGTVSISAKNLFQISINRLNSLVPTQALIIDRDMIFAKTEILQKINRPVYLKYNGEIEAISLDLIASGINIKSLPTDFYINKTLNLNEEGYVSFSLNHGYNKFINEYNDKIKQYYGINLISLPFDADDVIYSVNKSKVDKIGGDRYLNKIKVIN